MYSSRPDKIKFLKLYIVFCGIVWTSINDKKKSRKMPSKAGDEPSWEKHG